MDNTETNTARSRHALVSTLFPGGIPRLWCPLLTHYQDDGSLDRPRIAAHISHMRPYVSSFLAPGSTGDGWEMSGPEQDELVSFLLGEARRQDFMLMVGVLRTGRGEAEHAVRAGLRRFTEAADDPSGSVAPPDPAALAAALARKHICGFTVTPPKGSDLSQDVIHAELTAIARTGAPVSIYQLPQITENEMSAQTVADLEQAFPNIYLLKDTSGKDRVILSGKTSSGEKTDRLFLVRGAEGAYSRWYGSPRTHNHALYDGFLLSTANCFARELSTVIALLDAGNREKADELSGRIEAVVNDVFAAAAGLPFGNPFANANKAIDFHYAWGPSGSEGRSLPMTHSGTRLPSDLVEFAGRRLSEESFETGSGYVNG